MGDIRSCASDSLTNPDMQGIGVRIALIVTNICAGILIKWAPQDTAETHVVVQALPIALGTLLSLTRHQLSISDAQFALSATHSPPCVFLTFRCLFRLIPTCRSGQLMGLKNTIKNMALLALVAFWLIADLLVWFSPAIFKDSFCDVPDNSFPEDAPKGLNFILSLITAGTVAAPIPTVSRSSPTSWILPLPFILFFRASFKYGSTELIMMHWSDSAKVFVHSLFCFIFVSVTILLSIFTFPAVALLISPIIFVYPTLITFLFRRETDRPINHDLVHWFSLDKTERVIAIVIIAYAKWVKTICSYDWSGLDLSYGQWLALATMMPLILAVAKLVNESTDKCEIRLGHLKRNTLNYFRHPVSSFTAPCSKPLDVESFAFNESQSSEKMAAILPTTTTYLSSNLTAVKYYTVGQSNVLLSSACERGVVVENSKLRFSVYICTDVSFH